MGLSSFIFIQLVSHRLQRIACGCFPALPAYGYYGDYENEQAAGKEYPPMQRRLQREVFKPIADEMVGNDTCDNKAYSRNGQI